MQKATADKRQPGLSQTEWLPKLHGLRNYFMSDEPAILNTLMEEFQLVLS